MVQISIGILVAQVIVAVVSYCTLHRHQVAYGMGTPALRMPKGSLDDVHALETGHIDDKLKSGKYTVLQIIERHADKDLEIILGRIKNQLISKVLNNAVLIS